MFGYFYIPSTRNSYTVAAKYILAKAAISAFYLQKLFDRVRVRNKMGDIYLTASHRTNG